MIAIQPSTFVSGELAGIDEAPINRGQRQGFKTEHRTGVFAAFRRRYILQVLNANAETPRRIKPRFIRNNHPRLQRHIAAFRNALRALMDR